ncbi:MAG: FHA domain-containing protein [Planctomycetaceae bacterium]
MDHSRFRRFLSLGVGVTTLADIVPPVAGPLPRRDPVVELSVRGRRERFPLHAGKPFLIVGRSRRCDIRLSGDDVSPRHAYVQLFRGGAYCIDLASRRGTFWDSQRRRSGWLRPGEPVSVGSFSIACRVPEIRDSEFGCDAETLLSDEDFPVFGTRPAELIPLNARAGNEKPQPWRIRQPITLVGRHVRCGPRLSHSSVARFHCSLIATPSGLWVADLRSGRGTRANDRRVRFQRLREEDVVGIGDFRLKVHYRDSAGVKPECIAADADRPDAAGLRGDETAALQLQLLAMSREQTLLLGRLLDSATQNGRTIVTAEIERVQQIDEQIVHLMSAIAPSSNRSEQQSDLVERLSALNRERGSRIETIMQHLAQSRG